MLSLLWIAGYHHYNYPFAIIVAIFYLHKVDNVQKERLKIQMQNRMEEKRSKRVRITDTESVMWLNFLLQEMWPCWLERWLSKLVGECLHVNLSHYKPRALNKLVIDFLRLGSSPPVIQSVRVHRVSEDGDNAVMEMDVSFVAADDMRVELIAKLKRASVGLGLAGKLYGNNLRIEGKLRLGCKFVPYYPYLGQLTVAFVTVPILGLSVRPLSSSSVDVTDLPGIASWVTKAVQTAVETCLVEPYPLRLDLIKLCGARYDMDTDKDGIRFMHTGTLKDSKDVGFAILEILDGKNLEPKDRCGLPDPYVKITVDKMKFKTSIKKQTLHPVWHELFRIRICSWNLPSKILLRARDRDSFGKDDELVKAPDQSICSPLSFNY
ncbi:unnamed protein product [Sphagnum jensenii]|uniref:C2 domain-containing protein n=1 Tax=Sphagnum jensenii TaxID=128206 RepID=A0ABP1BTJ2_9BRYO